MEDVVEFGQGHQEHVIPQLGHFLWFHFIPTELVVPAIMNIGLYPDEHLGILLVVSLYHKCTAVGGEPEVPHLRVIFGAGHHRF